MPARARSATRIPIPAGRVSPHRRRCPHCSLASLNFVVGCRPCRRRRCSTPATGVAAPATGALASAGTRRGRLRPPAHRRQAARRRRRRSARCRCRWTGPSTCRSASAGPRRACLRRGRRRARRGRRSRLLWSQGWPKWTLASSGFFVDVVFFFFGSCRRAFARRALASSDSSSPGPGWRSSWAPSPWTRSSSAPSSSRAGVAVSGGRGRGGRRRRVLLVEPGLVGADARPLGPVRRLEQLALVVVVEDLVLGEVVLHGGDRRAELVVVPGQRVAPVAVASGRRS